MKTTSKQKTSIMKKIGTFIMALALVLGLSQCKKQETPATPDAEGNKVYISVKANGSNGGDRYEVYGETGGGVYEDYDKIYVGNGSQYLGTLTYYDGVFGGEITEPAPGAYLYFYFIGGGHELSIQPGQTSYDVDISDQRSDDRGAMNLPVLAFGQSTTTYSGPNSTYECNMLNKCALVCFHYTGEIEERENGLAVGNIPYMATIDFGDPVNGIKKKNTIGSITLYEENYNTMWAIMLPGTNLATATVEYGEIEFDMEPPTSLAANTFIRQNITINDVFFDRAWEEGAYVTIYFNHQYGANQSCTFYNTGDYGEDMFVWESGEGYIGSDSNIGRSLMIDEDDENVLIFRQNWGEGYVDIEDNWEENGFQVTFNKETKECTQWYGPGVAQIFQDHWYDPYGPPAFTRLVINGVDFTDQLIILPVDE